LLRAFLAQGFIFALPKYELVFIGLLVNREELYLALQDRLTLTHLGLFLSFNEFL